MDAQARQRRDLVQTVFQVVMFTGGFLLVFACVVGWVAVNTFTQTAGPSLLVGGTGLTVFRALVKS